MASESSRFQHLLQPIRDLSKNWNIDLAQELEEYLDELEHLTIAFDNDGVSPATTAVAATTATAPSISSSSNTSSSANAMQLMNFAEAALLIQGTSMIYSRKVEYLYALVFQTLAHLSKQQDDRYSTTAANNTNEGDSDDDDNAIMDDGDANDTVGGNGGKRRRRPRVGADADAFANPLPIYDELDEAKNITLKKQPPTQSSASALRRTQTSTNNLKARENNLQASIALMGSLVPDERDHGDTFKLLSCLLHPSGVLLLDEASKKYLAVGEEESAYTQSQPSSQHVAVATPLTKLRFDRTMDTSLVSDDGGGDVEPDFAHAYERGGEDEDGVDADEIQDQGPGQEEDIFASTTLTAEPLTAETSEPMVTHAATPPTSKRRGRVATEVKDPWAPLDPYDASKSTVRPFRQGRSYPARGLKSQQKKNKKKKKKVKDGEVEEEEAEEVDGVDDPAFKGRFLLRANRPQWSTWVWNEVDAAALETKFKKKYCKTPTLMMSFPSLWKLETKWKGLMRRSHAAEEHSAQAILLHEQADEEEEQQLYAMTHAGGMGLDDAYVTNSVQEDAGTSRVGDGEEEDDDDDVDGGGFDGGNDLDFGEDHWDTGASMSMLDGAATLKNRTTRDHNAVAEPEGERVLTYEEICRQHLEEFMKGTEQYIRETDLTRQVNDWQEKLSPILKEQDAHPPFDIHQYGREILGKLESTSSRKSTPKRQKGDPDDDDQVEDADKTRVKFEDIVGGRSQFQVCRLFLASLQLANNGNVLLSHAKTAADQIRKPFEMTLLSTDDVYGSLQQEQVA